ncbi:MAG: ABC transporter permease subunit [Coriobacteriia bacterium]|nr:ABC transporter permease subunit [Coriobacteriia bacterium]
MDKGKGRQSGLLAVFGKEFRRFFTDRRLVLTTVFLPGLMIYGLYSVMGNAVTSMFAPDADYQTRIYAVNLPDSLAVSGSSLGLVFEAVDADQVDETKVLVADQQADLLVIFPDGFEAAVLGQLGGAAGGVAPGGSGGAAGGELPGGESRGGLNPDPPAIEIYYNSARTESVGAYQLVYGLLDSYKNALAPLFTVNVGAGGYDLATDQDAAGLIYSMMMPMLILMLSFSGCMAVAPESIAGEKERGTIATLLVTPLSRWELALGKIVSLSCIALLSGTSSFIGVMLSLPKMMGGLPAESIASLYGIGDYLMLLGVILSSVLIFIGLIALLSALAKTVREAGTYVMPLMIVVMLVAAFGGFSSGASDNLLIYLIPIYNSVECLVGIFAFAADPLHFAVTIAVNAVAAGLCVVALSRMFGSERIVFNR